MESFDLKKIDKMVLSMTERRTLVSKYIIKITGWQVLGFNKIYKDNILIKTDYISLYGQEAKYKLEIFVVNDVNDLSPLLIYSSYYEFETNYRTTIKSGWININEWSIYAYHMIMETIEIIDRIIAKEDAKKFRKTFAYNRDEKNIALTNIKSKMNIPKEEKLKIIKLIQNDRELENHIQEIDKEEAYKVIKKLQES